MTAQFVIPCKNIVGRPVVIDCVASIRRHHPEADILVVDSDSDDRSYMPQVEELGADIADIANHDYTIGAYAHGWRACSPHDNWYLIHDSIVLNDRIDLTCGTVRWFSDPPHPWGWDADGVPLYVWGSKVLAGLGVDRPDQYRGVLGPMWFCDNTLMAALDRIGFFDIRVTTKYENSAMERVTGIVLEALGFDVTRSLQGEHIAHFGPYDESVVTKHYMDRM